MYKNESLVQLPDGEYILTLPPELEIYAANAGSQNNGTQHYPWREHYAERGIDPDFGDYAKNHELDQNLLMDLGVNGIRYDFLAISKCSYISESGLVIKWDEVNRAIDEMISYLNRDMKVALTLWHWDYPEGGGDWTDENMVHIFTFYQSQVLPHLQSRLKKELGKELHEAIPVMIILNEPLVYSGNTNITGIMPPYNKFNFSKYKQSTLSLAQVTKQCLELIHSIDNQVKVGTANNISNYDLYPAPTYVGQGLNSRIRKTFLWHDTEMLYNMMTLSEEERKQSVLRLFGRMIQLPSIDNPMDIVTFNFWHSREVDWRFRQNGRVVWPSVYGWNLDPRGYLTVLRMLHKMYPGKEIMVTEVGCHFDNLDDDIHRMNYFGLILLATTMAMREGINVSTVCLWSLIDNLEWQEGVSHSGVIRIEDDGSRTALPSAQFIKNLILTRTLQVPEYWVQYLNGETELLVHQDS